eukprot:CAMPEP_0113456290 /NCGR_PEP_ID=MMETSP0014_2-20120614/8811_1 /TAXON_ID=2857 /ORGANISM="Nitzschia sp." /LENGTH=163 /DNA_ID=CAMNT_0000347739 /DNA_START=119 /DNA_END=610 /DNA_ORIENTATION=+ /assembly_acc=CAM_ASM_000159
MAAMMMMAATTTTTTASLTPDEVMGDWKLVELFDDQNEPVEIPDAPSDDGFVLHLTEKQGAGDGDNDDDDGKTLSLYTKIGNNMGGIMLLVDDETNSNNEQTIKVGPLRSTMMMPPPQIFALETYLTKYLSTMDTLKLNDDGDELVLLGTGRIVCQNVAKAAV